jgi:hypothetical protein
VVLMLAVVLQGMEPQAVGGNTTPPPSIKLILSLDLGGAALPLPLPNHRGGGQGEGRLDGAVVEDSMKVLPGAADLLYVQYTAIRFVAVILGL